MLSTLQAIYIEAMLNLAALCLLLSPSFGQTSSLRPHPTTHISSRLTGTYIRLKHRQDENQSAQIVIKQISRSRLRFHLTALWWPVGWPDSPHNGEIESTVVLRNHTAVYQNGDYRLTLHLRDHAVVLTERSSDPDFGAFVSAAGTYRRVSQRRNQAQAH
jgi:hypothetical protein